MAVIKTYDISTVEEVKRINSLVRKTQENNKYTNYTKDNIMLVRTTDVFPSNRTITTLEDSTFIAKNGANFIHSAYFYELDFEELKKLESYELHYRSTIHFTENGLVSSHMYGNFDNKPFIILESLRNQLGSNIRNFAGQDTFIKGNVRLSQDAIIIVKAEYYETLKQTYPELDDYKIILYSGIPKEDKEKYIEENSGLMPEFDVNDERAIVEIALMDLGYVPELIGSHYIINSPTSENVSKVNKELASQYSVTAEGKHNYSEEYEEDFKKNLLITEIFNTLLLNFITMLHNLDKNLFLENGKITNNTAYVLTNTLGMETIISDIEAFNSTIEKMKELGLLPTSGELISNKIPDIYSFYIQNQTSSMKQTQ